MDQSGDNFLRRNYDKGRNNSDLSLNVNIDGHTIKSTPDLKLLRVTWDDKHEYNIHISNIKLCKLASKKFGVLVRLRKIIPTEAKL